MVKLGGEGFHEESLLPTDVYGGRHKPDSWPGQDPTVMFLPPSQGYPQVTEQASYRAFYAWALQAYIS